MVTRVIVGIVGGLLLLLGLVAGAVAAWGYLAIGTEGLVRIDAGTIEPGAASTAIVIDVDRFSIEVPYVGALGETALSASAVAPGTDPLFIGAAATPDVDAYLVGMPYSAAFRTGDQWTVRDIPGGSSLTPPSSATWSAQDTGVRPAISVPESRPLSLVILRPSGAPTGDVRMAVDFTIPNASTWLWGLVIAAALLLLIGALLVFLAVRRRRPRGRHAIGATPVVGEGDAAAGPDVEAAPADVPEPEPGAEPVAQAASAEPGVAVDDDETTELPVVVVESLVDGVESPGDGVESPGDSVESPDAAEEAVPPATADTDSGETASQTPEEAKPDGDV